LINFANSRDYFLFAQSKAKKTEKIGAKTNLNNARAFKIQNFIGSGMPRSRQILIAKWLLISLCLGTALRLFDATCRHQE
jgi:hypothetical protein